MVAVIRFDHVSKQFALPHEQKGPRGGSAWSRLRRRGEWKETFWALRDISLDVAQGETVGLIGANGSGKSTILKLIVRILYPTSGHVHTHGRITGLLELGAGFHPDLSGRDNTYLNGSILGLTRKEVDRLFDSIVDFSELERFIDTPVRHYSSGMYARLGFAIAVHMNPEVLLIDEALAVGDQAFQDKCLAYIHKLKQEGVSVLLVSHALDSVRDLCERAIWIKEGRACLDGPASDVVSEYLSDVMRKERADAARLAGRNGTGGAEITQVDLIDGSGAQTAEFQTAEPFTARIHYRAHTRVVKPMFGIAIHRADGLHITGPNNIFGGYDIDAIEGEGTIDYVVPALLLLSGNYFLTVGIFDQSGHLAYDHRSLGYPFTVLPGDVRERHGAVYMPSRWEYHNGKP